MNTCFSRLLSRRSPQPFSHFDSHGPSPSNNQPVRFEMWMQDKTMIFADGENLVYRYQNMLKAGRKPKISTIHIPDVVVWNDSILKKSYHDIKRISYYNSIVGDDVALYDARKSISELRANYALGKNQAGWCQFSPRIFKRSSKAHKESICDIGLAVDALRASYQRQCEIIMIMTGDGDFLSLLKEIAHNGTMICGAALSDGLNREIPLMCDAFTVLDELFFQ